MKLAAHLLRTDGRRFRLLLAAWMLIQVADAVMRGMRPALALDQRLALPLELLATVLFALRWLGTIVIVPLVVQMHPLVGSDAFWMTRPIPSRTLFTSKVLLLGIVLVAVPTACEACLMLAFRVRFEDALGVVLQTAVLQSLLLFSFMTVSVLTSNLARFALSIGGVLVGVVLLLNVLLAVTFRTLSDGPQLSSVGPRWMVSAIPVYTTLILLSAAAIALIIVQYRTRSRPRAVAAGLAGLVVAVLVGVFSPWPLRPFPVPAWATSASSLQLIGETTQGEFSSYDQPVFFGQSSGWRIGGVRARIRGMAPSWLAAARFAESSIELDDGQRLTTTGNGFESPVPFDGVEDLPLRAVIRHVLAVDRVMGSMFGRYGAHAIPGIVISEGTFREHSGRTGTYRGRYLVDLEQVRIASVLPLEAGEAFEDRGVRLVIERVVAQERTVSIRMRQFTTRTLYDGDRVPRLSFYLRNRDRSEAVAGAAEPGPMAVGLPMYFGFGVAHSSWESPGSGFTVTAGFLRFPEPYAAPDQPVIDVNAAWLSGAEFVVVRTDRAGSVERTLEIPGFRIEAAATKSGVRP
jgi:hypothetical protein